MTLPRPCLGILRHRPIYRVSRERITTLANPRFPAFGNASNPAPKGFVLPGDQRAASLERLKADSAEGVWISLAPKGFVLPVWAAIGYAEPRVGVRAFRNVQCPMTNEQWIGLGLPCPWAVAGPARCGRFRGLVPPLSELGLHGFRRFRRCGIRRMGVYWCSIVDGRRGCQGGLRKKSTFFESGPGARRVRAGSMGQMARANSGM